MVMAYISNAGLWSHDLDLERLRTVDPIDGAGYPVFSEIVHEN